VKSRIGWNRKYRNIGLFLAVIVGILRSVLARARHFIGIGRVQRERVNAITVAL